MAGEPIITEKKFTSRRRGMPCFGFILQLQ